MTSAPHAPGATLTFEVEGKVGPDGIVEIGCQRFSQAQINDVARNMRVTEPPRDYAAGTILRAEKPHPEYGEFFLVGGQTYSRHYANAEVWSLSSGTFSPLNWWESQTGGRLVPVYGPQDGKYTDTTTDRRR